MLGILMFPLDMHQVYAGGPFFIIILVEGIRNANVNYSVLVHQFVYLYEVFHFKYLYEYIYEDLFHLCFSLASLSTWYLQLQQD